LRPEGRGVKALETFLVGTVGSYRRACPQAQCGTSSARKSRPA
jgi:hypothetical protein